VPLLEGYPFKALARLHDGVALAESLPQQASHAHALEFEIMASHLLRDPIAARCSARELVALGQAHALGRYVAKGKLILGLDQLQTTVWSWFPRKRPQRVEGSSRDRLSRAAKLFPRGRS
jgi:hypothetical protein